MKELNRYQNIAMEISTSENPLIHSRLFSYKITKRLTFRVFLLWISFKMFHKTRNSRNWFYLQQYLISLAILSLKIKGLKYTRTPLRNIIEKKRHAEEFTRKLRLIEMCSSEDQEIENWVDTSLVKAKSSFHPPQNRNTCVDKLINFLQ